ncbi:C40 family peptidase [Treponema primitia]|uniref:NlpC/P60 family protein n=1 Tax=Treponema primitia TaxID=88058 RepID=UPI0039812961
MGIKWDALFLNEKKQFEKMTEAERFIYFLLLQYGSPYGWGKENPESSDCSGAVCLALYAATGLFIRTTADDLYRRVFTVVNPAQQGIRAAFFIDGNTGKAGHVAGLVGDGVILNSQEGGARVRSLDGISAWFWNQGASTAVRGLDRAALVRLAGGRYERDQELAAYFSN